MPVASDVPINELRELLEHRFSIKASSTESSWPKVADKHIGLSEEVEHDLPTIIGRNIGRDSAFTAVVKLEHRVRVRVTAKDVLERTVRITGTGLDFDDVSTPVTQDKSS